MKMLFRLSGLVAIGAVALSGQPALAASVYLEPATQEVAPGFSGPIELSLFMDFAANESTLGGGVDLQLNGILGTVGFTPSGWFTSGPGGPDPSFSGHGSQNADHDYEVHFGHFNGLSGLHELGTVRVDLSQPFSPGQVAFIALSINTFFGDFYSANPPYGMQNVTLTGAQIAAVPEPGAYALMLIGLGVLGIPMARRRRVPAAERP